VNTQGLLTATVLGTMIDMPPILNLPDVGPS